MNLNLTIMFALAGSLFLQSCAKQTSFTATSQDLASKSLTKNPDVVEINNEIDLTVRMASCPEFQLSCTEIATKYKRSLDIAQMQPEQSVFVQQGDIFIFSSGANKNLKKLDQSANAGMVQTCGIDIEDVYVRSGTNMFLRTNINVMHSAVSYYVYQSNFRSYAPMQP